MMDDTETLVAAVTERVLRQLAGPGFAETSAEARPRMPQPRCTSAALTSSGALAALIDHTLLKPDATAADVRRLCEEAKAHGFAGVCVNATHIRLVAEGLAGSPVLPVAVVGFPLGATLAQAKAFEAREAVRCGAREIDMVIDLGALKAKDFASVLRDIRGVVEAAQPAAVKVILETCLLTDEEKVIASALAKAAGAAFVKTSTGFSSGGATVEDVALLRRVVGDDMGVKASGGIRSSADALRLVDAGASRLGASTSVALVASLAPESHGA